MKRSCFARTVAVACVLGLGSVAEHALAEETTNVTIENFTFKPATVSVKRGTSVTFTNADDIPHSVVGTDGSFRSKALDTGDRFTFSFQKPGDFGYFCGLHPHMQGHIVVVP